jgi:anti-sigma28 factor (negative regulator of flagellin synthesis)
MEHLVTEAAATPSSTPTEVAASIPQSSRDREPRRQRMLAVREAIDSGEYRVAAGDLADALLRTLRRAN